MTTDIFPKKINYILIIFLIVITIGESKQYEAGGSYTFIGPTAPGGEIYSYMWIASDGFPTTSRDISFQWTAPQVTVPTKVTISLVIDNGCTSQNETELLVIPSGQTVCAFNADTPVCAKSMVNYASLKSPTPDATYVWSILNSPGAAITADPVDRSKAIWSAGMGTSAIISVNATLDGHTSNCSRTVTIQPSPIAEAGPDQVICNGNSVQLAGSATNSLRTTWTASGDGSFDDAGKLYAVYTPGAKDIASGTVTLTLSATGESVCDQTATSDVVITIQECKGLSVTVADEVICSGSAATLRAVVSGCTVISYQWYIGDSPSGEMIPDANLPTYQTTNEGVYTCVVTCDDEIKSYGFASVSSKQCESSVGSISGRKFEDKNGNSEWDSNEPGLGGWIINLKSQNGEIVRTATTSANPATLGSYSIGDISPGTYTLEEVASFSADWTQTYPAGNIYTIVVLENGVITVTKSDHTEIAPTNADLGNKFTQLGELEITKTSSVETLDTNKEATFTITVQNTGNVEVHDLKIVDELSPMLEFIPYAYYGDILIQHTIADGKLIFDLAPLGSLQPGNSWTIAYNAKLGLKACTSASSSTISPPVTSSGETELNVMAAGSESTRILQIIDSLSRNRTKLEAKLESIMKMRDKFDKAGVAMESGIMSIAGTNYTLINYTNISTGETLNVQRNATGFLVLSEYTRPAKRDQLTTTYDTKGEAISDFYTFFPTRETLKIEYNKPDRGYRTYTVRCYATGDTLIMTIDSYGIEVFREYRKTPGLSEPEYLTNCATAYGSTDGQDGVVVSNRACVDLRWSCQTPQPLLRFRVFKEADQKVAKTGDIIKYKYTVVNTGTIVLTSLTLNDDKLGIIVLNDPDPLEPGESLSYYADCIVKEGDGPKLENIVIATALDPDGNAIESKVIENVEIITGCLTKTASPKVARPGDYVTYNITWYVSSDLIVDNYPRGVYFISASPTPVDDGNNNRWKIDPNNYPGTITVLVQVAQDIGNTSFDMDQGVSGTGFVNVHNDIRTNPVILKNKATLYDKIGEDYVEKCTAYALVNVGPPQTYIALKEHGSGNYASEDVIRYRNSNRSIQLTKGLTATHKPTTFSLPNNRNIDFMSKWSEKAKSKNYATGGSTNEEYTYASRINQSSSLKLDENGSTMETETDFEGMGYIGLVKKDADENKTWNASRIFESQEDYVGSFKIDQKFDEYGKNVEYEKSVNGTGYVSARRDLKDAQSSYESGTGNYQSDEKISTAVNYITKDMNLTHQPTSYNYTPTFSTSSDIKWSEALWSKTSTSLISEQFSSATNLTLHSIARGLNEMVTEAEVTGQADFRTVYRDNSPNSTDEIDQEENYVGDYEIYRKTSLSGVAKYDRPHISLNKIAKIDLLNTTNADYQIIIENNGNRALGPVYVKDIFPAGTEYITSSLRPAELTTRYANWSLPSMGIGSKVIIDLQLNITEEPSNLVNQVEAAGKHDNGWTLARNFSAVRLNWLTCCPPQISAFKTARVDALHPQIIWYTLSLKNREKYTMVAFLMDQLPARMKLLNSSQEPSENRSNLITWTILDLAPGENRTIVYRARAASAGVYVNVAHIEAFSVDGPDFAVADVEARIDRGVGGAPPSSLSSDWQPPTCFCLNCSGWIYSEDWVPCYTCTAGEPGNAVVLPPCASCMDTGDDSLP